jgi:hypothetical protein
VQGLADDAWAHHGTMSNDRMLEKSITFFSLDHVFRCPWRVERGASNNMSKNRTWVHGAARAQQCRPSGHRGKQTKNKSLLIRSTAINAIQTSTCIREERSLASACYHSILKRRFLMLPLQLV